MKPVLTLAFALVLAAPAATGEEYRIGPDPCPAPADAAAYRPPSDLAADDPSPWAALLDEPVIVDMPVSGGREDRRFKRLWVDPETGYPFGAAGPETDCESKKAETAGR